MATLVELYHFLWISDALVFAAVVDGWSGEVSESGAEDCDSSTLGERILIMQENNFLA